MSTNQTNSNRPVHCSGLWLSVQNSFQRGPVRGLALVTLLCLPLLALSACRPPLSLPLQSAPPPPSLAATTHAAGDSATIAGSDDDVIVTISSATGIGEVELQWPPEAIPASLTLHLQLRGLEELRLDSANANVTIAVLSSPPHDVMEAATLAGQPETPITPDSPYWATVTIEPTNGDATIPLEDGYFAVHAPPQLLADAQGELAVHWVDFYR